MKPESEPVGTHAKNVCVICGGTRSYHHLDCYVPKLSPWEERLYYGDTKLPPQYVKTEQAAWRYTHRPSLDERAAWFHRKGTSVAEQVGSQRRSLLGTVVNAYRAARAIYRWLRSPCK